MSQANISSTDRLGVTLLFSMIFHGVLALGLTFDFPMPQTVLPSLDVTLLRTANFKAPEDADFLAQANNSGGGPSEDPSRPSQPVSSNLPKPDPGTAPQPLDPSAPRPRQASGPQVLTTRSDSKEQARNEPSQQQQEPREVKPSPQEIRRQREMAQLAAEVRAQQEKYAQRPKVKYLTASTREYAYAAYMRAWVARVQRIGNLNYPEQARQRQLYGNLILTVVLNPDGSVAKAEIIQSSGYPLLDDAALRIVRLAAPFPPVPDKAGDYDQFNITRTWQFLPEGLRTRG